MERDIDDGHVELSHVVPVTPPPFESAHHLHHTKFDHKSGAREQTRQVVRQEDEPAGRRVLRFRDDVVKARHREEEPERCQDGRRLVEQRVRGRRGHGAEPVNSKQGGHGTLKGPPGGG